MSLKFGTDGVRGVANTELSPELVLALGRAAARVLPGTEFFVGRDTRISGPMLQVALAAGLTAEGASVTDVGVLPTPAVAFLSAAHSRPAAMISASHNPFADNGIKLFAPGGLKLSDAVEEELEADLQQVLAGPVQDARAGASLGGILMSPDARDAYLEHLAAALQGRTLAGLTVALDCANGAASAVAERAFREAGAEVVVINADPDGTNINDGCGSTHPQGLQDLVVARGADVGLAFDGDADRVLAVDATGRLVDGDHLMAIAAVDLHERAELAQDTVVVTVMTNLGFRLAMAEHGIHVVDTQVGDRNVLEALEAGGFVLGGEQSGHVIYRRLATTGDGLLTGLLLLDVVKRRGQSLEEQAKVMTRLPQVLLNVRVGGRAALDGADDLWAEVAKVEAELGEHGRVLLRPSGTEPLIRVMVEAPTQQAAAAAAERLSRVVEQTLT